MRGWRKRALIRVNPPSGLTRIKATTGQFSLSFDVGMHGEVEMGHTTHARAEQPKTLPAIPLFPFQFDFGGTAGKGVRGAFELQKEILDAADEANRAWLARSRLEAVLTMELINKLLAARSMADASTACQQCMTRRLDLMAEDVRRIADDGKKIVKAAARVFGSGHGHAHRSSPTEHIVDSARGD
jgi:hypothetical protein